MKTKALSLFSHIQKADFLITRLILKAASSSTLASGKYFRGDISHSSADSRRAVAKLLVK